MKKESPRLKGLKHQARVHSIKEGIFSSGKIAFGSRYLAPFAIAIKASNSTVALLTSLSGILGPISQMFGSRLIGRYPRKKILLNTIILELLVWMPFIFIAILFFKGIFISALPLFFLLFFSIYIILANFGSPAWFSWMGDVVDKKYRGRWFSKRNLIMGFVSFVLTISTSFFLDYSKRNNWTMIGFSILFLLAMISRLFSWKTFKMQYEPKTKFKQTKNISFWKFLRTAPKTNFGRFSIFRFFFSFSSAVSGSLVTIYLLRYLHFDYTTYMIIAFSGTLFSLAFMRFWGKFSDKYGNYRALGVSMVILPIVPILWVINTSPIYLVFVPSALRGIAWAGFHLAESNFAYDSISKAKRGMTISYYRMLMGAGIFLGAGVGALLIKFLHTEIIKPIIIIFLLSSLLRMLIAFFGIPFIKDVKKIKKISGAKIFKEIAIKDAGHNFTEEFSEIASIPHYLKIK